MFSVKIKGTYYKEKSFFSDWNARNKKRVVYFYDYDDCVGYIINQMSYSELGKLKINIYHKYHDLIKFTRFGEVDLNGDKFEGLELESPIINISYDEFAKLIPSWLIKKRFFTYDKITEKYSLRSDFINYCKLHVV